MKRFEKHFSPWILIVFLALLFTATSAYSMGWSEEPASEDQPEYLTVCSFNIQFLGNFKDKEDEALASILTDYDVVVIQELVAPPYALTYADGTDATPDPEAAEFFNAMLEKGFAYWLSEEDTGTGDNNHVNSSSTEWWVVFYKPSTVSRAEDLPVGFLAEDRTNNDDYERVPYAFGFRDVSGFMDFVLIPVHLKPGSGPSNRSRRKHELASIAGWIDQNDDVEKDFIILGDMNIYSDSELNDACPTGFVSLNDECRATNTNTNSPEPYDHVLFRPNDTCEIDTGYDMQVVDLVDAMETCWVSEEPYPGEPYDHNEFRKHFSDHHPVVFRMTVPDEDDDGVE